MPYCYFFKEYDNGELVPRRQPVEIVKYGEKTYLVKLLHYCRGHQPGDVIRVRKKNIKFVEP